MKKLIYNLSISVKYKWDKIDFKKVLIKKHTVYETFRGYYWTLELTVLVYCKNVLVNSLFRFIIHNIILHSDFIFTTFKVKFNFVIPAKFNSSAL